MSLLDVRLCPSYNCAHFVCDVWKHETGDDISNVMECFLAPSKDRKASAALVHTMQRIPAAKEPCIVLLRRHSDVPHVGVYLRRMVLHLTECGPIRQTLPVAMLGFNSVRYYVPRPYHS